MIITTLCIDICMMNKRNVGGSTIPEVLVAMLISGIVLLLVMDGFSMLQSICMKQNVMHSEEELLHLQYYEMLVETTDSVSVSDSIRFYKGGVVKETMELWRQKE